MKIKHILVNILFFTIAIQSCFAQVPVSSGGNSISENKKYNDLLLGENVFVFDQDMDMKEIQVLIDTIFNRQAGEKSEFNKNRYALLFKPGKYNLDIKIGYYMQVAGMGASPEDVIINGAVRSNTTHHNSVLTNFWRSAENLTIIPSKDSTNIWGVSQAAPLRRVHIKGNLQLFDKGYASGGFLADSKIDGIVTSGPQQQWFSRNTSWGKWSGGNWNMMFVGVPEAPAEDWPAKPFTIIKETPLIREKPYITFDKNGYNIRVPLLKKNSSGPDWDTGENTDRTLPLSTFYIASPGYDTHETINGALEKGKNLIFTPGIYYLDKSLKVTHPGTVITGIGMPSLTVTSGNPAIELSDVDGISVCGITIDAGQLRSDVLFQVGEPGSLRSHEADPVFLYDVFFRVGGPAEGSAKSCMVINSKNVVADHIWLWRGNPLQELQKI